MSNDNLNQKNGPQKSDELEKYKAKTERIKAYAQIITQIVKTIGLILFI
ncbi:MULTISPECIES: hypothetical protein [Pseudoalteromonas]|nr:MULTISPECIES: hypothetical protein [Pseudoalteromonas]